MDLKQSTKKTGLRLFGPPIIGDILASTLPDDPDVKKSSLLLGQGDPNAGFKTGELPADFKVKDRFEQAEPSVLSNIGKALTPLATAAGSLLLNSVLPGAGTALGIVSDNIIGQGEAKKDPNITLGNKASINFNPKENVNLSSFTENLGFGGLGLNPNKNVNLSSFNKNLGLDGPGGFGNNLQSLFMGF